MINIGVDAIPGPARRSPGREGAWRCWAEWRAELRQEKLDKYVAYGRRSGPAIVSLQSHEALQVAYNNQKHDDDWDLAAN